MKKAKHSPEQIVRILREAEGAQTAREVIRRHNISEPTFYQWKKKYSGMGVSDLKKLKTIQDENGRLKRLVAEQALTIQLLEDVNSKKW